MNISSIPSNSANTIAPFAPLGRQTVGNEGSDLKASSLKALEQSAQSARSENRRSPEDNPADRQRVDPIQQRPAVQQNVKSKSATKSQNKSASQDQFVRSAPKTAVPPTYELKKGSNGVNRIVGGESPVAKDAAIKGSDSSVKQAASEEKITSDSSVQNGDKSAASLETEALAEQNARRSEENRQKALNAEQLAKAQKEEDTKKADREERIRKEDEKASAKAEDQKALAREQERAAARRIEQENSYIRTSKKQADVNRQLVEIGVASTSSRAGRSVNRQV